MAKAKAGTLREFWDKKRASLSASKADGKVRMWRVSRRLHVSVPFNEDFRQGAIKLSGNYRPRTEIWSFRIQARALVFDLVVKVYGKDAIEVYAD